MAVVSVVALRWHYPTDALAGLATGAGTVVLLADCGARAVAAGRRHRRSHPDDALSGRRSSTVGDGHENGAAGRGADGGRHQALEPAPWP